MRKPEEVLNSLKSHAKEAGYQYKRLYRNLYNPEFYLLAYENIQAGRGNMTPGTDGKTIDGMSTAQIEKIIDTMRNFSYKPAPARRINIPKANGKTRPLGIPSFEDKLVQEVVRMLLSCIYEPTFSDRSHGFRPGKSCHTAIGQIRKEFSATKWFIEGDIVGFFDNINHHVLINILKERIEDEQFIALIWKFLKAGYMEYKNFHNTYSGTPQGSIISPMLSNIYLDKLDRYMEEYATHFNKGSRRKDNKEYRHLMDQKRWLKKQKYSKAEWQAVPEQEKSVILEKIKEIDIQLEKISSVDNMDGGFKRLRYCRYADDFLCGVTGSKREAEDIKKDIGIFLKEKLCLELSDTKTAITRGTDKAKFLGFEICTNKSRDRVKKAIGGTQRPYKGNIKVFVPKEKWLRRLLDYGTLKIKYVDGKEVFEPIHRNCLVNNDDLEILNQYNSEIRGIYNYYCIADNVSVLNDFYYIMSYSMYKTYAAKYKTHISNIRKKYGVQRFAVPYINKSGKECKAYFYHEGFRVQRNKKDNETVDLEPTSMENLNKNSLLLRLKSNTCEICGATGIPVEVHHVRKLKDLKGKVNWEKIMIGRRRKTLITCIPCHDKIHAGKLD